MNVQNIANTGRCIGCGACYAACPKGHIEYKEDGGLGFPVPQVMNCEACGNCLRICPSSELYEDEE